MHPRLAAALAAAILFLFAAAPARADLLIHVDKATQQMTVSADGELLYTWPVSTGRDGYDTPNGAFNPIWMDRDHHSQEWDDAPMPHAIFFTKQGHAIHGTYEARHLGQPVSHGCVRLSVKNASILWDLVKKHKMASTMVVLTGETPGGSGLTIARVPRDDQNDIADTAATRRWRASHDYYGPPRVFFGRERAYYPPPRRYDGGLPFGW